MAGGLKRCDSNARSTGSCGVIELRDDGGWRKEALVRRKRGNDPKKSSQQSDRGRRNEVSLRKRPRLLAWVIKPVRDSRRKSGFGAGPC